MRAPGTDAFYGAPVVLVVLANRKRATYLYDGSLVIRNMMLAAPRKQDHVYYIN